MIKRIVMLIHTHTHTNTHTHTQCTQNPTLTRSISLLESSSDEQLVVVVKAEVLDVPMW